MDEFNVNLPDGRVLECAEAGDPAGHPVFVFHGTPGSRIMLPAHIENASELGIRLISYNRPGYGASTRAEGRVLADVASDVNTIAENMGLEKFAVWGHSGGGAPAIACAALLPERVVAAASIAGVAPYGAEGLDFYEGMGEYNVEDFKLLLSDQDKWMKKNIEEAQLYMNATRDELLQMLSSLLSEVDREALTDEMADFLHRQGREAGENGVFGMLDDNLTDLQPWGFDPASVSIPLQVWHGRHDKFVPFGHGQWLAGHIPRAEPHLEENEGHLSIFANRMDEIHRWLIEHFR